MTSSEIVVDIDLEPSPTCLLGTFLDRALDHGLNPDLYQLVWHHNQAVVPLHCQTRIQGGRAVLRPKPRDAVRSRRCRFAIRCPERQIEAVHSTRQTFWDILLCDHVAYQVDDDGHVHVADVRIDGGTHVADPHVLMHATLEAVGLGLASSIRLHVTYVPSSLSEEDLHQMHQQASERRSGLVAMPVVPADDRDSDSDELGAEDFANFRSPLDLKSGRIDRLLCELRQELPIARFRDTSRTLLVIVRNIVKNPGEAKFRVLKATNPTLLDQLFQYDKVVEILGMLGFTQRDDRYEISDPIDVALLERAAFLLRRQWNRSERPVSDLQRMVAAAANRQSADGSEQASGPVPRDLTIFDEALGVPPNPQLADDGVADYAEGDLELLSAAARDLHRRAKYADVLVPQSFVKEQLQATSTYVAPTRATIRVRIQRRIIVQANYAAHETLRDVADVVRSVLNDPQRPFRFVVPPAAVLDDTALDRTLSELKLAPSAVMYAEFTDDVPLHDLMTDHALSSAQRLQYQDRAPAQENAPSNTGPAEPRPKQARSSRGRTPAWFKK